MTVYNITTNKQGILPPRNLFNKGFTLVELLVVVAVLGIIAGIILIAINPGEQMAKGRDSTRKTAISQLGRAVIDYYAVQNGSYPANATTWGSDLVSGNEIKNFPRNVSAGIANCTSNFTNGFCYQTDGTQNAVVYSHLESNNEAKKFCGGTISITWFVWSSAEGKAGAYCNSVEPSAGITGLK